eukprot:COSAG03_NODE_1574_length_3852_cov_26.310152_2_plen_78_part_00
MPCSGAETSGLSAAHDAHLSWPPNGREQHVDSKDRETERARERESERARESERERERARESERERDRELGMALRVPD